MQEIFSVFGVSVVAITMALTEIIKKFLPEKITTLIPLVVGIIVVVLARWSFGTEYILQGLVVGLASMGVFKIDHDLTNIGKTVWGLVTKVGK
jgi:hypothetical protein